MGLYIKVLKINRLVDKKEENRKYPESWWPVFTNGDEFKDRNTKFQAGVYDCEVVMEFDAGSYRNHGSFRSRLAQFSGLTQEDVFKDPEKCKDIEFFELINFYDNEGTLDYITAGKLLKDFNSHLEEMIDDKIWLLVYNDWLEACRLCVKHKGMIYFN